MTEKKRIALCPHFSVEHFRGGEKWVVTLANNLVEHTATKVSIRAYPYAPDGKRRVSAEDVLDSRIEYTEQWVHDLSEFDTAYVFYHPGARYSFLGAERYIAGIHSWVYVSQKLHESHYGPIPTGVKILFNLIGTQELRRYDTVHTVTPAFQTKHSELVTIPNFVDTDIFYPNAGEEYSKFTVLVTAAHIPEKGWDYVKTVAENLPDEIQVFATGDVSHPEITGLGFLSEPELASAYASSHVVLHPARVDTDSMVINESCASGTPVITSPLPTHTRENIGVIHAGTITKITYCIKKLYAEWSTKPEVYESRCRSAHQATAGHKWETVFPQLQALLMGRDDSSYRDQTIEQKTGSDTTSGISHD